MTPKKLEAMKLALEALEEVYWSSRSAKHDEAITAMREALAEQPAQQEPVAAECKFDSDPHWMRCEIAHHKLVQSEPQNWPGGYQTRLLYRSPPPASKPWVDLTDKERADLWFRLGYIDLMIAIEEKLMEKNT